MTIEVKGAEIEIDEQEQQALWDEVGQEANSIAYGKEWWAFAQESSREFVLIRREPHPR
jgi:hypothetical protein